MGNRNRPETPTHGHGCSSLGSCFVGQQNARSLLVLVLIPQFVYLCLGTTFLLVGITSLLLPRPLVTPSSVVNALQQQQHHQQQQQQQLQQLQQQHPNPLIRQRDSSKSPGEIHRRHKILLTRVGLFATFYAVTMFCLTSTTFYEWWGRERWLRAPEPSSSPRVPSKPLVQFFVLRLVASLGSGIVTAAWIWWPNLMNVWRRLPPCKQPPHKCHPHGVPVPVVHCFNPGSTSPTPHQIHHLGHLAPPQHSLLHQHQIVSNSSSSSHRSHKKHRKHRKYHSGSETQNLESVHENSQKIKIKSKRKKIFADKNKKLSHKLIRKWISNVNAHTVPLSVINVNISTSEILFQVAPARFSSTLKNKWNSPLVALFNMHTIAPSIKKKMQMEYGQFLEKSTELLRLMDKSNKTEELLPDLSSAIGKSAEISKNISSEKSVLISIDELPEVIKFHDVVGLTTNEQEKIQSPNIAEESFIPDASPVSSSLPSYLLTKRELLALLEIIWQNNQFATFTDIISPDHYNKLDASSCFIFLLGSAVAMIGANLRFGIGASGNVTSNATKVFQCHPGGVAEATVIFSLGALGMGANIILMSLILVKRQLRRYFEKN
ncbi:hypothetical protein HZH68_015586 [Vespula germanica]|uniref:Frizzled/Smoothened 7TM domain-containing protein n=1 Tax=Vespula germanica TaxID=30212 RepID=A0A834J502_VESGE|nr:hypothetical protein HZH68_015586 [Vespula germanica]